MAINRNERKRIIFAAIAGMAVVAIILYSYFIDTSTEVLAPKCMLFKLTGFKCPGCGTQRALHELAHLNFGGFFRYNPILSLAIPYIVLLLYMQFFGGNERFPKFSEFIYGKKAIMWVFYLIIAYWALRNVFSF